MYILPANWWCAHHTNHTHVWYTVYANVLGLCMWLRWLGNIVGCQFVFLGSLKHVNQWDRLKSATKEIVAGAPSCFYSFPIMRNEHVFNFFLLFECLHWVSLQAGDSNDADISIRQSTAPMLRSYGLRDPTPTQWDVVGSLFQWIFAVFVDCKTGWGGDL